MSAHAECEETVRALMASLPGEGDALGRLALALPHTRVSCASCPDPHVREAS